MMMIMMMINDYDNVVEASTYISTSLFWAIPQRNTINSLSVDVTLYQQLYQDKRYDR